MGKIQDLSAKVYELEIEVERLQRKLRAGPYRKWIETDDADVIKCMNSQPECIKFGCQARILLSKIQQVNKNQA